MPRVDNPVVHLAAAVAKLGGYQPPMRLNETTRMYFQRLASISSPEDAFLYQHLEDPAVQEKTPDGPPFPEFESSNIDLSDHH